jgi:hypothetical protein
LSHENDIPLQRGLIITDDIDPNPILGFDLFSGALTNIILNSYPKFTIGIFGDWGTGKTTLMNSIENELSKNQNVIRVKFETWRYEREEQFALIPLLKSIAFALPEDDEYQNLRQKLKRGATYLVKKTPDILASSISKQLDEHMGIKVKDLFESIKKEINSRIELLAEIDRDTLYFDGLKDIRNEINKIKIKRPSFRIVVFVDDLDRCSPKKTLEILESIKVFLGMDGFIYVLGMSHSIISKLIELQYSKSGVKGDEYIKKIIQIPITLPKWESEDISKLVYHFLEKQIINDKYIKIMKNNIDLISTAINNNPRDLKRFLNNFIVAFEIYNKNGVRPEELLVLQAVQLRWDNFYHLLLKYGKNFINEIRRYSDLKQEERTKIISSDTLTRDFNQNYRIILRDYVSEAILWDFLKKHLLILENIRDWTLYQRAIESTRDISELALEKETDVILHDAINQSDKLRTCLIALINKSKLVFVLKKSLDKLMEEEKFFVNRINPNYSVIQVEELKYSANKILAVLSEISKILDNGLLIESEDSKESREVLKDYEILIRKIIDYQHTI